MPASDNLDEQPSLQQWVADNHISVETLKLLEKDGFTCMAALALLEKEDISHKITRGQQKLILKAVSEMPDNRKASAPWRQIRQAKKARSLLIPMYGMRYNSYRRHRGRQTALVRRQVHLSSAGFSLALAQCQKRGHYLMMQRGLIRRFS